MKNPFVYHKPTAEQVERMTAIREACGALHELLLEHVPEGGERSVAIGALREASMWANAGIVMEETQPDQAVRRTSEYEEYRVAAIRSGSVAMTFADWLRCVYLPDPEPTYGVLR